MRDRIPVEDTSSFNQSSNQTCQVGASGRTFFILVYTLLFLVGLILNGFIMKFFFCGHQQKTSSIIKVYLKNLVAADFLLCLCLPVRILNYATNSITIHKANCYITSCVLFLNMYASILFMGYIAANRYLKIVKPSGTHILQTVRAAHIVSTVTWTILLSLLIIYIIVSLLCNQRQHPITTEMRCEDSYNAQQKLQYKILHICCVAVFFSVLVCLLFFYCSTLRRVSLVQQRDLASSSSKKLVKSHRNMLVLVSVFCVCFIPYHLIRVPFAFLWGNVSCPWSSALYYLMELSTIVSLLNVCLDPLIYFFICKAFRGQFSWRVRCLERGACHQEANRMNPDRTSTTEKTWSGGQEARDRDQDCDQEGLD